MAVDGCDRGRGDRPGAGRASLRALAVQVRSETVDGAEYRGPSEREQITLATCIRS